MGRCHSMDSDNSAVHIARKEQTMRIIDADALIDRLDYCVKEGMGSTIAFTFKHMVEEAPSIDIVRCKECRHRNERCGMGEHRWCEILNMSTTPDDYCSYGERKESE